MQCTRRRKCRGHLRCVSFDDEIRYGQGGRGWLACVEGNSAFTLSAYFQILGQSIVLTIVWKGQFVCCEYFDPDWVVYNAQLFIKILKAMKALRKQADLR